MSTRKVTVVSTKTNVVKNYQTDVTTWGDLVEVIQNDFQLKDLKATENVNKTTLEHVDAVLPEGDFRVFLRPTKTKSGVKSPDFSSMGFKELRSHLDDTSKEYLNKKYGKNWTQLKTVELQEGLTEFHKSAISGVVESVKESKKPVKEVTETDGVREITEEVVAMTPIQKLNSAKTLIEDALEDIRDNDELDEEGAEDALDCAIADINSAIGDIDWFYGDDETKKARKAQEDEDENAAALREAKEMEDGFM